MDRGIGGIGTVKAVESRASRWSPGSGFEAMRSSPERTSLAARAKQVAGAAALQARVAERRGGEAKARQRGIFAAGAAAAAASLCCSAVALVSALAPDLVSPQLGWGASAAAILCGLGPAGLLAAVATGRYAAADGAAAVIASAKSLETVGTAFGRAIVALDAEAHPKVAHAVDALVEVLEIEARVFARTERPQSAAAPTRRHRRIVPNERRIVVRTTDGRNLIGTIADISLSGLALTASLPRMAVGDIAMIGSHRAVVARLWERGIAFQFDEELDPASFDEAIVL